MPTYDVRIPIKPAHDLTMAHYVIATKVYPITQRRIEELIILDDAIYQPATSQPDQLALLLTAVERANVSYLHYANFTIYNQTYHASPYAKDDPRDVCGKCNGAGGSTYSEYQGDPPMGGTVDFFDPCGECIGAGLCPGCMQPLAYTFDYSAFGEDQPLVKRATGHFYASNSGVRTIEVIGAPVVRNDGYESQTYGVYEYDAYQLTADEAAASICNNYSGYAGAHWFSCACCGWQYDPERLDQYEPDYDDDYDYPDDDPGFDPMFLM